jgi:acetoin utilization protein AcuB
MLAERSEMKERKDKLMLRDVMIRDWMTKDVITVAPDTPIANAHQVMKQNKIRRLVVVDKEKIVGMITIGDIREASPSDATSLSIWEMNYLWAQLKVAGVMSKSVVTVRESEPVINAARIMLEKKVSGLPVLDDKSNLVGVITESDVFRMLVKNADQGM